MRVLREMVVGVSLLAAAALLCAGCGVERVSPVNEEAPAALEALPIRDGAWETLHAEAHDATVAARADAAEEDEAASGESGRGDVVPASAGLSVGGLSTTNNALTVDGLSAWQAFRSGPRGATAGGITSGPMLNLAAIQELRYGFISFAADTGGAAAGVMMRTHSGGAALHGTFFARGREAAWAAANPYSLVTRYDAGGGPYSAARVREFLAKPEDTRLALGGSVGGPLVRSGRLQGFGSVEADVRSYPVESAPGSADFFRLSASQMALLGNRGVAAPQVDAALGFLDSLMGTVQRSSQRWTGFARGDWEAAPRDHVAATWMARRYRSSAGSSFASASDAVLPRGRGSVGDEHVLVDAFTGLWTHAFATRWANDLRGQWSRDWEWEQPRAPLPGEPAVAPGGFASEVSIGPDGFLFGTPSSLGRSAYPKEMRVELAERLEWVRGRNAVRVGGDWSRVSDLVASVTNAEGTFSYDSGVTGGKAGGLVDWITDDVLGIDAYPNAGCPSITAAVHRFCFRSYTQSFGEQRTAWTTHEVAAFGEDTWRPARGFTATVGARWEYTLLPLPQAPNAALDANLRLALAATDRRAGTTAAFPEDRNNVGARLGVSWAAPMGFTLRLGYGAFFGRVPGATVRAALSETALPATVRRMRITPTTETACPQQPMVSFGYGCAFVAEPPSAVAQTTSAVVFARGFRVPVVQRLSLRVEHRLGAFGSMTLGYSGALAQQLPGSVDVNIAPSTSQRQFVLVGGEEHAGVRNGETFALPAYTARLLPQYGPVSAVTSVANATYHALVAEAQSQWRTLQVRGSYAWSRSIDYAPQMGATPQRMTGLDPFANGYDKGRSALDYTHHFAGVLVASPSLQHGSLWQRRVLNGWQISAIGSVGSGAPYSYIVFGGTELSGGRESLNGAGGATYLPTVGRNTLRLPVRGRLDVRVARVFDVGTRWRGEAFAEAFNALNERNLTRVETRAFLAGDEANGVMPLVFQDAATVASEGISTPPFGMPLSSTSGLSRERQLELGVRLRF